MESQIEIFFSRVKRVGNVQQDLKIPILMREERFSN